MADKETIATCVSVLCEAYRRKPAPTTYTTYEMGLEDLPNEDVMRATKIALKQKASFMPTPAELIEYARTNGISYEAQAALAFEELDLALARNQPSLMSPIVAAIARQIGGFDRLYSMPIDEFHTWKRKDFLTTYVTLAKENPKRLEAIAGPSSDLAVALAATMRAFPTPEEIAAEENENRKKIKAAVLSTTGNPCKK